MTTRVRGQCCLLFGQKIPSAISYRSRVRAPRAADLPAIFHSAGDSDAAATFAWSVNE